MSKIQIVSLLCSLIYLTVIFWNVRQQALKEAYALLWVLSGVIMLVVSIWTDILTYISQLIGIVYPPATLFLLMLAGIIIVLFQYSILLSRNQEKITRLTQETALLRKRIEDLEKKK